MPDNASSVTRPSGPRPFLAVDLGASSEMLFLFELTSRPGVRVRIGQEYGGSETKDADLTPREARRLSDALDIWCRLRGDA